jgi:hypothetical protein
MRLRCGDNAPCEGTPRNLDMRHFAGAQQQQARGEVGSAVAPRLASLAGLHV